MPRKKGKVKKNLERHADKLVCDIRLTGMELVDDPIINTKSRRVEITSEMRGVAEVFTIAEFNKQANQVKKQSSSVNYYDTKIIFIQEATYSNYKKFLKSSTGSHIKRYETAKTLLKDDKTIQQGINLYERIPGVSDMKVSLNNYDTAEFLDWT